MPPFHIQAILLMYDTIRLFNQVLWLFLKLNEEIFHDILKKEIHSFYLRLVYSFGRSLYDMLLRNIS